MKKYRVLNIYHYYDGPLVFSFTNIENYDNGWYVWLAFCDTETNDDWYSGERFYNVPDLNGKSFRISEDEVDWTMEDK